MKLESTITKESKLPGFSGVRYTVRKMTEGMRVQIRLGCAEALARLRDIEAEREEFFDKLAQVKGVAIEQIKVADLTPHERRVLNGFADRIDLIKDADVNHAYFEAGFVGVEGVEIDGKTPDANSMRSSAPPALYHEILRDIMSWAGLGFEEKENLGSPSTSGAGVDGKTQPISAPPAGETEPSSRETAESTSPTE